MSIFGAFSAIIDFFTSVPAQIDVSSSSEIQKRTREDNSDSDSYQNLKRVKSKENCPICFNNVKNSYSCTDCEKDFCRSCIIGWVIQNPTCPCCRSDNIMKFFYVKQSNESLKNFIVRIFCKNQHKFDMKIESIDPKGKKFTINLNSVFHTEFKRQYRNGPEFLHLYANDRNYSELIITNLDKTSITISSFQKVIGGCFIGENLVTVLSDKDEIQIPLHSLSVGTLIKTEKGFRKVKNIAVSHYYGEMYKFNDLIGTPYHPVFDDSTGNAVFFKDIAQKTELGIPDPKVYAIMLEEHYDNPTWVYINGTKCAVWGHGFTSGLSILTHPFFGDRKKLSILFDLSIKDSNGRTLITKFESDNNSGKICGFVTD